MDVYGSQCGLRWQMVLEIELLDPRVAKERKKKKIEKERKKRKEIKK